MLRPAKGLALGLLLLLPGCKDDKPKAAESKPEVGVVTMAPERVVLTTELPGRTNAFRVAEIRPQVSGLIQRRMFQEGQTVKPNQQLYQIDPAPYQATLATAQASVAKAMASSTSSQAIVKRYRPLAQAQAVSGLDLDNAVASMRQADADVASARASVKSAEINLAYTSMASPIAGRTGRSSVTEGALVTANQSTSLVTVTQLDPIYVDVTQPSAALLRIRRELAAGQIETAGDNQAVVRLVLEDGTVYDKPGKLQFSEVTVDQGTGSVTLRSIFTNPDSVVLPGMFVRERLEEGVRDNALLVPQRGVTHDERGEPTALVVGKDGKVEQRTLVTDRAIGAQWLVNKGLAPGDRVVVDGVQKAKPGSEVTVKEANRSLQSTDSK